MRYSIDLADSLLCCDLFKDLVDFGEDLLDLTDEDTNQIKTHFVLSKKFNCRDNSSYGGNRWVRCTSGNVLLGLVQILL